MTEQEVINNLDNWFNARPSKQIQLATQDAYWQQVHIQAAIAAMQGMIANPQTFEQLDRDKGYKEIRGGDKSQIIAIASVMYADALIAELQKKGRQDEKD